MIEKLKASVRDVVLAAVAAFVGAISVALSSPDVSVPFLKAAVVTAAYAALRVGVATAAAKFSR